MLSEYIVCHINLGNVFKSMMRLEHNIYRLPVSFANSKQ